MSTRKWVGVATTAIAIVMATVSVAWACGNMTSADMKLENATDEPWDGGADQGKNWSDCAIGKWDDNPHTCGRPVTVTGSNFENSTAIQKIDKVDLYWVDEPFYAAGLGGPNGPAEQLESKVCIDKGVRVAQDVTVTNKAFVATITIPPTASTTTDGTLRIGATSASPPDQGKFWYGTNAVCAVWDHTSGGLTHKGSVGNSYNIYP